MFLGKTEDINQGATQSLIEAVSHMRRASDNLSAIQALMTSEHSDRVRKMRALIDQEAIWLDQRTQSAVEAHFHV